MLSVHSIVVLDLDNTKHPLWSMLVNQKLRSVEPFLCVFDLKNESALLSDKACRYGAHRRTRGQKKHLSCCSYSTSAVDWFRTTETQESKTQSVVSNPRPSIDRAVTLVNKIVVVICAAKPRLSKRALALTYKAYRRTHKYIALTTHFQRFLYQSPSADDRMPEGITRNRKSTKKDWISKYIATSVYSINYSSH